MVGRGVLAKPLRQEIIVIKEGGSPGRTRPTFFKQALSKLTQIAT
jgi:hypothetical protein